MTVMKKSIASVADLAEYPELLKPCDVQRILGITRDKTYRLFHSNGFPLVKTGVSSMCVPKARLVEWLGYEREVIGLTAGKENG